MLKKVLLLDNPKIILYPIIGFYKISIIILFITIASWITGFLVLFFLLIIATTDPFHFSQAIITVLVIIASRYILFGGVTSIFKKPEIYKLHYDFPIKNPSSYEIFIYYLVRFSLLYLILLLGNSIGAIILELITSFILLPLSQIISGTIYSIFFGFFGNSIELGPFIIGAIIMHLITKDNNKDINSEYSLPVVLSTIALTVLIIVIFYTDIIFIDTGLELINNYAQELVEKIKKD